MSGLTHILRYRYRSSQEKTFCGLDLSEGPADYDTIELTEAMKSKRCARDCITCWKLAEVE